MAFVAASEECLRLSGSKAVTLLVGSDDTTFTFDHVAGPQTTQEQFFGGTYSLSWRCPSLLLWHANAMWIAVCEYHLLYSTTVSHILISQTQSLGKVQFLADLTLAWHMLQLHLHSLRAAL